MTARALMWKEAVILGRCRWLFLCVPLALCTPMAANILATTPLFDLGTCFLILSIAVSCFGGELVFRTSVGERRSGGLDVLLVAIKSRTLLALGKTLLPAMTGSLCTLAGLAINDLAAPFYTGKALYVGMLTPTTAAAVCFTSFMCSLLDLVLLMRSREEVPLRGNTALMFALTVFMSCLYVFGGRLHPLLPIFVSMLLAGLCLLLAAASLSRPRASLNVRPTRPDTLELAVSPLTALAAKDLAAVRSWLRLLIRYVLLVATGTLASGSASALSVAAWFPALAFPAAELLYPALVHELTPGALDVLHTALGSRLRAYCCKCALPLAAAQPGIIAAALFAAPKGLQALLMFTVFEAFTLVSAVTSVLIFNTHRSVAQARTGRVLLYLLLAAEYALAALILI